MIRFIMVSTRLCNSSEESGSVATSLCQFGKRQGSVPCKDHRKQIGSEVITKCFIDLREQMDELLKTHVFVAKFKLEFVQAHW